MAADYFIDRLALSLALSLSACLSPQCNFSICFGFVRPATLQLLMGYVIHFRPEQRLGESEGEARVARIITWQNI